jgi:hypothetical protein
MTAEEKKAAIGVLMAVGEAIRDFGSVPSGELYAFLMDKLTLDQYNNVIRILKNAGLIKEEAHLLTWSGPKR